MEGRDEVWRDKMKGLTFFISCYYAYVYHPYIIISIITIITIIIITINIIRITAVNTTYYFHYYCRFSDMVDAVIIRADNIIISITIFK